MTPLSAQLMIDVGHQAAFGALAAWGFGVLFNFDWRSLDLVRGAGRARACGADVRARRRMEPGSGVVHRGARGRRSRRADVAAARRGRRRDRARRLHPDGAGRLFGKAILGLFALTAPAPAHTEETAIFAIVAMTRVILTLGAIGAGLAIPSQMSRHRGF